MNISQKSLDDVFKYKNRRGVDKAIDQFFSIKEPNYELIKERFFSLFGVFPFNKFYLKTEGLKTMSVYRMRPVKDVENNRDITQYGCPPPTVKKFGRANWEGRNVFYGSDTPLTCIRESKNVSEGEEFYISQWAFREEKLVDEKYSFCSMAIDNISENNPWRHVIKSQKDYYRLFKKNYSSSHKIADAISYFAHRLSVKFAQVKAKDYHVSAFIADRAIYNNPIDSIWLTPLIFPSVESFDSCNFVFHPSFVEDNMYLDKIVKIKITNRLDDGVRVDYSDIGIPINDKEIQWYNMELKRENLVYQINSIKCNCGKELDLSEIDGLTLNRGDEILNREQAIVELTKDLDLSKLSNLSGDMLQEKGVFESNDLTIVVNTGLSKMIDNVEHHNLNIDITIRQFITYVPI